MTSPDNARYRGPRLPAVIGVLARETGSLLRNDKGSVTAIAAIVFPVLIGGMGLGTEVGYWYLAERKLQHAADVAAYGAAIRLNEGESLADVTPVALHIAKESGFLHRTGDKIQVYHPTVAGVVRTDRVKVELGEKVAPVFSRFFGSDGAIVHGAALAAITSKPGQACLIALSTAAGPTISLTGNGNMTLNKCSAAANTTKGAPLYMKGSATLSTACVYTGNGKADIQKPNSLSTTAKDCQYPDTIQIDTVADPYKGVVTPPTKHASCTVQAGSGVTLGPVVMKNGVRTYDVCNLSFDKAFDFDSAIPGDEPVMIIVRGDITSKNVTVTGTNITFFLTNGGEEPNHYGRIDTNNGTMAFSGATAGDWKGLLFFGDPGAANATTVTKHGSAPDHVVHNIKGNMTSPQGAFYFPGADLVMGGNGLIRGCMQVIADTFSMTGTGDIIFDSDCDVGMRKVPVGTDGGTVALIE